MVFRVPVCLDLTGLRGADIAKVMFTYVILQRIYDHFDLKTFSDLRLLVVIDEAHQIFKTESQKGAVTQEPLPVRITRLSRKFGFGMVIASQLASDIPEEALANVATVIAFMFDEPRQVGYIKKFVNLSRSELEVYANLPCGAAFVKRLGRRHPNLVKVQMVSDQEIKAAETSTERVGLPITRQATKQSAPSFPASTTQQGNPLPGSPDLSTPSELPAANELASMVQGFSPLPQASESQEEINELTSLQKKVLRFLEIAPVSMKELLKAFPGVPYRRMLNLLEGLYKEGLTQEEKVANIQGKGTVFYASLRAEWLQTESLEHRAIVKTIAEALKHLRPFLYLQSKANAPDIALELAGPGCIEVETGRKKLKPSELEEWARGVKERDRKLGFAGVLVVVPNSSVEARYKEACQKYALELVTIGRLLG